MGGRSIRSRIVSVSGPDDLQRTFVLNQKKLRIEPRDPRPVLLLNQAFICLPGVFSPLSGHRASGLGKFRHATFPA